MKLARVAIQWLRQSLSGTGILGIAKRSWFVASVGWAVCYLGFTMPTLVRAPPQTETKPTPEQQLNAPQNAKAPRSQVVEVPGMGDVEFPDWMSNEDIAVQIRKELARRELSRRAQVNYDALAAKFGGVPSHPAFRDDAWRVFDEANRSGASQDQIIALLTRTRKFDVEGALKAGYSKADIINHLLLSPPAASERRSLEYSALLRSLGLALLPLLAGPLLWHLGRFVLRG